jgi:hypothetical protein
MSQDSRWFLYCATSPSGGQTTLSPSDAEEVEVCLMHEPLG